MRAASRLLASPNGSAIMKTRRVARTPPIFEPCSHIWAVNTPIFEPYIIIIMVLKLFKFSPDH